MNFFGNFFDFKKFFRTIPKAHLFENLRFDIFYRFNSRFSIFKFFKFSKKKMGTQMNFFENFFDFKKLFRSIPRAHLFKNLRFEIFSILGLKPTKRSLLPPCASLSTLKRRLIPYGKRA